MSEPQNGNGAGPSSPSHTPSIPNAEASGSNTPTSPAAPPRDRRLVAPGGITMPGPPSYHNFAPNSPRSSHFRSTSGYRVTTPTGLESHGYSSTYTSPAGGGPLSPGLGPSTSTSSFIFPIRSVFAGMSQGEGGGSPVAAESGNAGITSSGSRGKGSNSGDGRAAHSPKPRGNDRRFSQSVEFDQSVGISSIAQMLAGQEEEGLARTRPKPTGETGHATFTGKVDRTGGEVKSRSPRGSPYGYGVHPSGSGSSMTSNSSYVPGVPYFSAAPLANPETSDSPFFREQEPRRFSCIETRSGETSGMGTPQPTTSHSTSSRPSLTTYSSGGRTSDTLSTPFLPNSSSTPIVEVPEANSDTSASSHNLTPQQEVKNPSAEASGSGLPQRDRAPVGQPQEAPTGINFRDRPGPDGDSGENISFSDSGKPRSRNGKSDSGSSKPGSNEKSTSQGSSATQLLQPKALPASASGGSGVESTPKAVNSAAIPTGQYGHGSESAFESEDGEVQLVNDFASIVRLGDIGSRTSMMGHTGAASGDGRTGTESRARHSGRRTSKDNTAEASTDHSSGGARAGRPTQARLAQQQREIGKSTATSREGVLRFIDNQSHTQNMSDPNAHTPSSAQATPAPIEKELEASSYEEAGMKQVQDEDEQDYPASLRRQSLGTDPAHATDREMTDTDDSRASSERASGSVSTRENSEAELEPEVVEEEPEPVVTMRYEHVATEDGHHMVVGREGKLSKCEDEPITTPGAIQGFGVLIVLEEDYENGTLIVRQVSENSTQLLGLSPNYLFRLDCFSRILTDDQEDTLRDNLEYLPDAVGNAHLDEEGPQVFLLSGFGEPGTAEEEEDESEKSGAHTTVGRRQWTCWVGAHRPKQPTWNKVDAKGLPVPPPDLVILEFELERDNINPLMQTFEPTIVASSGRRSPDSATNSAGSRTNQSDRTTNPSRRDSDTTTGTTPQQSGTPTSETNDPMSGSRGQASTQRSSTVRAESSTANGTQMGLEGLDMDIPLERIIESTTNHARPLRALERMRRSGELGGDEGSSSRGSKTTSRGGRGAARRQQRRAQAGGTGTMDVFAVLGQMNEQLGSAPDLDSFLKVVVGVVQDVCRFHRVLLYQFDESFNGQVVAELVEWGKTTDLYKGLMFPAADIPAQARNLYMINKVRLLYDRSQTTARMVLREKADLDHPLDMTHCFLRAMSPIHIKYLANMHVRSSMSVSIMAFGQLWGLIACHTYGYHGMRVSFPVRQMMRILSDSISRNIERLSYAQRLHTRKLISTIPTQAHPTGYIVSNADDLLQVFDADAGLLVIGSGCKLLGVSDQGQAMLAIAEYLRITKFDNLKASNHLARDFPDLALPKAHDTMAGLLYVPLTAKAGQDFIVFLRKGQAREVKWAGKPYKDEQADASASLEPRKSFKTWSEVVTGRSRVWTDDQLESAGVLALIYGKFIQVWREKQSAMANNQLTAILLSNTSHAVRTPLSQIINTLELALAGNIDDETRAMLENSHKASRALLFHVHDLLDLTRIETGNETSFNDPFDLRASIQDAVRLYQTESARRGLDFRVTIDPKLPKQVIGDSRKIRTVISNLVANSVKFTPSGFIEVYCGVHQGADDEARSTPDAHVLLEFVVADSGVGIATEKLQAMFVTLEGADEVMQETGPTGLGLGLAVVARIVEQLDGQLRAESEVGVGSRFFFTLEMLRYDPALERSPSTSSLVAAGPGRMSSGGSGGSVVSAGSGGQASEIDSFVHDFGASHMFPSVGPNDPRLQAAEKRMNQPGTFPVTDSSWPVRPTRVDTETSETSSTSDPVLPIEPPSPAASLPNPRRPSTTPKSSRRLNHLREVGDNGSSMGSGSGSKSGSGSGASGNKSHDSSERTGTTTRPPPKRMASKKKLDPNASMRDKEGPGGTQRLRVLVVEDDMINCQILTRRLKMDKHTVLIAGNGQEAVDILQKDWDVDVVLMDIQMPIMDGRTAAAEIRKLEATNPDPEDIDPLRLDGRIPIIAVSASLYESDRSNLSEHFDGWLLKPLDFTRVRTLLIALQDPEKRMAEVYVSGHWEKGGFFRGGSSKTDSPRRKQVAQMP